MRNEPKMVELVASTRKAIARLRELEAQEAATGRCTYEQLDLEDWLGSHVDVLRRGAQQTMTLHIGARFRLWWHCLTHLHRPSAVHMSHGRGLMCLGCLDCPYYSFMTPELKRFMGHGD